jgi:hypothetical protein
MIARSALSSNISSRDVGTGTDDVARHARRFDLQKITPAEATKQLGVEGRTFQNWRDPYERRRPLEKVW